MEILGENISGINLGFKVSKSPVVWGDKLFRKGKLSFLEPLLFHTPSFKLVIWGSALYRGHLWYPIIGKKRIEESRETELGKLFETYSR